jgi:hypothetical protein
MIYNNETVTGYDVCESFAKFFEAKVNDIVKDTIIDPTVHSGVRRIYANDNMFMTRENIINSVKSLKIKNSEGYDRIPQRVLIDGLEILIEPLTIFFSKVSGSYPRSSQSIKRAAGAIAQTTDRSPIYAAPPKFSKK